VAIDAGDTVQCMIGGANRDPDKFPEADRYDFRRENAGQHVSFGVGRHFCLGAALARLETRLTIEALLDRCPGLSLDPERDTPPSGAEFRKPATLHVVWSRHA
jgi:cytochrome P450